nr:hypothetical protein CFP56_52808 [Quercus suber]
MQIPPYLSEDSFLLLPDHSRHQCLHVSSTPGWATLALSSEDFSPGYSMNLVILASFLLRCSIHPPDHASSGILTSDDVRVRKVIYAYDISSPIIGRHPSLPDFSS